MYNQKIKKFSKMKKFLMTIVAAIAAVSVNAQVYVGGGIGFASYDNGAKSYTSFKFLPEIGYVLDEDMAIGVTFGYEQGSVDAAINSTVGSLDAPKTFSIAPYLRYNFVKLGNVTIFADGQLSYKNIDRKDIDGQKYNGFGIGVLPGVAVNLNEKLIFVSHLGFFGYNQVKSDADGAKARSSVGLNLSNGLTFGLYYNF
jgi:hypothetical protein